MPATMVVVGLLALLMSSLIFSLAWSVKLPPPDSNPGEVRARTVVKVGYYAAGFVSLYMAYLAFFGRV